VICGESSGEPTRLVGFDGNEPTAHNQVSRQSNEADLNIAVEVIEAGRLHSVCKTPSEKSLQDSLQDSSQDSLPGLA